MQLGRVGAALVVVLLLAILLVLAATTWQHVRYLNARRGAVQDHQPLLYPSSTFHVVSLVELAPGADLFAGARRLVAALEEAGGRVVYAGKRLLIGLRSPQLPQADWDFVLLTQYPSREAYDAARGHPALSRARAGLARTFDQGMRRGAWFNFSLPMLLLARRVQDVLLRRPARYPFEPADDLPRSDAPEDRERARRLAALREPQERGLGRDAVVVVNFVQHGTPEQRERDAGYVGEMLGLMAEQAHGPMHMGTAVTVQGDARFDQVALVYYPGAAYFAEMAQSTFYGGIAGGKQLGDSLAMITAPFLDRL